MYLALTTSSLVWLPLILGASVCGLIAVSAQKGRARSAYLWIVPACVLLVYGVLLLSLCGQTSPATNLYKERCNGGVPWWPLVGIPILLLLPVVLPRLSGVLLWLLGLGVVVMSFAIPLWWLNSAN